MLYYYDISLDKSEILCYTKIVDSIKDDNAFNRIDYMDKSSQIGRD